MCGLPSASNAFIEVAEEATKMCIIPDLRGALIVPTLASAFLLRFT